MLIYFRLLSLIYRLFFSDYFHYRCCHLLMPPLLLLPSFFLF